MLGGTFGESDSGIEDNEKRFEVITFERSGNKERFAVIMNVLKWEGSLTL